QSRPPCHARARQSPGAVGTHDRQAATAGAGRARLARGGDGYLRAGKIDGLDARACPAAGFAAVPLARAGGGFAIRRSGFVARGPLSRTMTVRRMDGAKRYPSTPAGVAMGIASLHPSYETRFRDLAAHC